MTNLLQTAITYKAAVLQLMLGEANFASQQLKLATPHPIKIEHLEGHFVPAFKFGFGGTLETASFAFCVNKEGVLWKVVNLETNMGRFDLYPTWAKTPATLTTNGVYQLATNWLTAIQVDVNAMEAKNKPEITQLFFFGPPSSTNVVKPEMPYDLKPSSRNIVLLPAYEVKWGDAVKLEILATDKQLLEFTLNDSSLSRRPRLVLTNAAELNAKEPVKVKTRTTEF